MMLSGNAAAVFVLRGELRIVPAMLPILIRTSPHGVCTLSWRRARTWRCLAAAADAQRAVSREHNTAQLRSSCGLASTVSSVPGRDFFICTAVVNTSKAPSASSRSVVADDLGTQVVEVRLQHSNFVFVAPIAVRTREHDPIPPSRQRESQAHWSAREIARPSAVANLLRRHRRTRAKTRRQDVARLPHRLASPALSALRRNTPGCLSATPASPEREPA